MEIPPCPQNACLQLPRYVSYCKSKYHIIEPIYPTLFGVNIAFIFTLVPMKFTSQVANSYMLCDGTCMQQCMTCYGDILLYCCCNSVTKLFKHVLIQNTVINHVLLWVVLAYSVYQVAQVCAYSVSCIQHINSIRRKYSVNTIDLT